jgi:uncharacterized protein with HEPN domain
MKDDKLYLIHIGEKVWNIVQNDLPVLKSAVGEMLGPTS